MLNAMPICTIAIMPQFMYDFIIFNNYLLYLISIVRLQHYYTLILLSAVFLYLTY